MLMRLRQTGIMTLDHCMIQTDVLPGTCSICRSYFCPSGVNCQISRPYRDAEDRQDRLQDRLLWRDKPWPART